MLITMPDNTLKSIMETHKIANVSAALSFVNRIIEKASKERVDDGDLVLKAADVHDLRQLLGGFVDAADLVRRIKRMGTIRVQGHEFMLEADQIARLKQEAFGHARNGEPRSEKDATTDQAAKIVNRYLDEQITYFMKMMCSQL